VTNATFEYSMLKQVVDIKSKKSHWKWFRTLMINDSEYRFVLGQSATKYSLYCGLGLHRT